MNGTDPETDATIQEWQRSGSARSIIGLDCLFGEQVAGWRKVGDRMKAWGRTGAFRGLGGAVAVPAASGYRARIRPWPGRRR